ncbi:hypothetical protein EJV47_19020 [Hymenobacter gummosus]|uniref:Outer membrane protein beta-barrel domain-containing protein n=1 Tax=Hymenobacter gummosus TaxID=1776032 RepID=A0A3S0H335_9BACT|nr:hypothetical protein [Hymenobacter gummosus]RTQ47513.1 hypothetical protein EJV47_19020 [Hymenobacter gummosus]
MGYFVTDKLALGLGGGYIRYRSVNTQTATPGGPPATTAASTSNRYGIGPFARYYWMLTDKLGFYGQLDARYGHTTTDFTLETPTGRSGSTSTMQGGTATLMPGAVFFLGRKVGLEVSAGSVSASSMRGKTVPDDPSIGSSTNKEQYVTASFNLVQFRFGASVYLGQ